MSNYNYVKSAENSNPSPNLAFNPAANGNRVVVVSVTSAGAGAPTASIADDASQTWRTILATASVGGRFLTIFECRNSSTATTALTLTYSGGTPSECYVFATEYNNVDVAQNCLVEVHAAQAGPGATTDAISSGSATVGSQPAAVVGIVVNGGDGDTVAGTGFTGRYSGSNQFFSEDKRVTATGSNTATATAPSHGGADDYIAIMLAFAETSAGVSGSLAVTESGSDTFAASGGVGNNGLRLTLRNTDTGALAASLTGLIVSVRAASDSTSVLASTTSGTTDGSGVFQLASTAIGSIGTFVYVTVEKSDHSIVAAYRVQVIDLNA